MIQAKQQIRQKENQSSFLGNQLRVQPQKYLRVQFKVYVLEHLIVQLIKKKIKKPMGKLRRYWIYGYDNSKISEELQTSSKRHKVKHLKEIKSSAIEQEHRFLYDYTISGGLKGNSYFDQSSYQRKVSNNVNYTFYQDKNVIFPNKPLYLSSYSGGIPCSDFYLNKKQLLKADQFISFHGKSSQPFQQLAGKGEKYSKYSKSSKKTNKQANKLRIKFFAKLLLIVLSKNLKNCLTFVVQALKDRHKACQANSIEQMQALKQKLMEEINDLNDDLIIKKGELELASKELRVVRSQYCELSQLEIEKKVLQVEAHHEFRVKYNSDDQDERKDQTYQKNSLYQTPVKQIGSKQETQQSLPFVELSKQEERIGIE